MISTRSEIDKIKLIVSNGIESNTNEKIGNYIYVNTVSDCQGKQKHLL